MRPTLVALRALGLGDLLTAVPALRALADAYAGHRRALVTTPAVAPLARHLGLVDKVVEAAPLTSFDVGPIPPAVAVNLHGRGPESHELLWALRPGRLIAFGVDAEWRPHEHEVRRWCRLLEAAGVAADAGALDIEPPAIGGVPTEAVGATVVHPGAASGARRWPVARWAEVARAERATGRRVVVTGGPAEVRLASHVAGRAGLSSSCVLAGRTDVLELAAVVAAAGRVVCGDTGIAHLATALRRPSVVLFGPVPPSEWGPPPDRPWHRALWAGGRGNGGGHGHGGGGDPRADEPHPRLLAIAVDDVLAALHDLPAADAGRAA